MMAKSTEQWALDNLEAFTKKASAELDVLGNQIPYIPEDNHYVDMGKKDISWWTNGFWAGTLWQLYHFTKDEKYKQAAQNIEGQLDNAFADFRGLDHDVGFMWTLTAVADYKETKSQAAWTRALHAATILAGRYNPKGHFIKAWNPENGLYRNGWVIIDSLMNAPLLYWAQEETHDPKFGYIAKKHVNKIMKYNLRADGSVNHICVFDPENGELLETKGGQGYGVGSCWSRGEAWAIYGSALNYKHSKKAKYLNAAKRAAHYFISNIQQTGFIPLVDFRAPKQPVEIDTTAAAIAASGLLEIAKYVPELEHDLYYDSAIKILKALADKYVELDPAKMGIVTHGSVNYVEGHADEKPIIYGDYFYAEALLKVIGKELQVW